MVMIRETRERQTPSAAYDAVTRPMSPFLSFYFLTLCQFQNHETNRYFSLFDQCLQIAFLSLFFVISVSFGITKSTDISVYLHNEYGLAQKQSGPD